MLALTQLNQNEEHLMPEELSSVATSERLPMGVWKVDDSASHVAFAIRNLWGLATVRGEFDHVRGVLTVGEGSLDGELTIDASSLNTHNKRRDKHLRSADFFGVEQHPELRFETSAVTSRPGGLTIAGDLHIRESRLRLHLPVDVYDEIDQLVFRTRTVMSPELVGLGWNRLGMIGSEAAVSIELTLAREP
jgi:polyisoprenoid-binding protein YceI